MRLRPWLVLSLCLNLLLVGTLVWATKARRPLAEPSPVSHPITNGFARRSQAADAASNTVVEVRPPFSWRQVESPDYRVYVKNLRAIGCPEATIRDIVVADINELFAGRVRDLVDTVQDRFWSLMLNEEELKDLVEEKQKELGAFKDEHAEILEALLGEKDPVSKMREEENRADSQARWMQIFDFLPTEKAARAAALKDRFEAARRELSHQPDEREQKARELDTEEERQLRLLLTPEEFDEYKLRTSAGAEIRSQLADFDATEAELHAIARAKMNQQEAQAALNRKDANYRAQLSLAQTQTDEQTKQLLGPERFAAYQRASDDAYRQTLRITERFELPPETAVHVYQMRKEAEAQARKVRDDTNRPVEERQAILQAVQAETERSVSETLGARAFKAYQQYGGDWLSHLSKAKP